MKKLIAFLSGALTTSALFASPVLSPNTAAIHTDGVFFCDDCSIWSLRAGFRGDYVWNRHLNNVDVYQLFSNSGVLTLNIWDRVDIYGFVGATSQNFATNFAGDYIAGNVETETIWGVGARATLWETCWGCCGTTYFGIDGNYESVSTGNITSGLFNGIRASLPATDRYTEWQVSLQAGQRINLFTPYVAIKWSRARATISALNFSSLEEGIVTLGTPSSARNFGYAVGVALVDAGRVSVQAEARFVDEKAATIQAEFRF